MKITVDTYKKLITFYKFKPDDYEMWDDMLHYLDSECITEAVDQWIRTKSKTPTVADIATLAEELELSKRIEKTRNVISEEAKEKAKAQMYEEYLKATAKGYVIAVEPCGNYYKYSWLAESMLAGFEYRKVRRYYEDNEFFVYYIDSKKK